MASPFAAAVAAAAATHDAIMAETFEYHPMRSVDDPLAAFGVDPDRAPVLDLLAPWGDSAARAHADAFREPGVKSERPGHATSRPFISLDLRRLPYESKLGDIIVRKVTLRKYKVAEVLPSSPGFVRLDLNRI
ncbi:MAG: hypothetical protein IJ935_03170 [Afipia sp.]|nr:hypothetical protein [Afipia sp.]